MKPDRVVVKSEATGSVLCRHARVAATFLPRFVGLLGTRRFEPGDGLLLRPSSAVHTLGMAFAIDVIALGDDGRVLALRPHLRPQRVAMFSRRVRDVLELPAGEIERLAVRVGDRLRIVPVQPEIAG